MHRFLFPNSFGLRVVAVAVAAVAAGRSPVASLLPEKNASAVRWSHQSWGINDGLPDGVVRGIVPAPDGSLVIGTEAGMARLDGSRIRSVDIDLSVGEKPNISAMLSDGGDALIILLRSGTVIELRQGRTKILHEQPAGAASGTDADRPMICRTSDGTLWVAFGDGSGLRIQDGAIEGHASAGEQNMGGQVALAADGNDRVWLASGGRLSVFGAGGFSHAADLPEGKVCLAPSQDGGLWIAAGRSLLRLGASGAVAPAGTLPEAGVMCMHEDLAGRLWIGTSRNGLFCRNAGGFQPVTTVGRGICSIAEDRDGNLWVGSSAGLNRVARSIAWLDSQPMQAIRSLCVTPAGARWFVTESGNLGMQPAAAAEGRTYAAKREWPGGTAVCLAADEHGTVWIGTTSDGLIRHRGEEFTRVAMPPAATGRPVRAVLAGRTGDVWLAVDGALLRRRADDDGWQVFESAEMPFAAAEYDDQTEVGDEGAPLRDRQALGSVRLLAEDQRGRIWAGTAEGDVLVAEQTENGAAGDTAWRITVRTPDRQPGRSIVTAICPTGNGSVWVALADIGLFRFKEGSWDEVGDAQHLPTKRILTAVVDHFDRLWCVCGRRIMVLSLDELEAVADRPADCHAWLINGTDAGSFTDTVGGLLNVAAIEPDGQIRVATRRNAIVCDPAALPVSASPPQVVVEELRVDGQCVYGGPKTGGFGALRPAVLSLPPAPGLLEIALASRSFVSPANLTLEHRMAGIDPRWVRTPENGVATYFALPGGDHQFNVRSANDSGAVVWEGRASPLTLRVQPRFWERAWVRAASGVVIAVAAAAIGLFYSAHRSREQFERLRRQAAVERERARIARDMHDDVGTSLTQIAMLAELACGDADPAVANARLQQVLRISHDTVAAIDELVWAVNPANDTLPRLVTYIGQCAIDTLSRFGVRCRVDAPADLPPLAADAEFRRHVLLMAKEAIHNVVEHSSAHEVHVAAYLHDTRLQISIADDGGGIGPGASTRGDGLANMRRRADDLGGRCEIGPRPGGGTLVTFDIPVPQGYSLA